MAFGAETAKLIVDLSLGGNFTKQLKSAQTSLGKFDKSASRSFRAGQQIGTGIKRGAILAAAGVGALVTQVGFGLDQLIELESLTAQTNAVLKSTQGVAGQTAGSIRALAEEFESMNATIDDKVIQNAENLLLTFTNIRGKAFKPTLQAALNMNQALGGGPEGLAGTVQLLGRALSDPEKGLSRLERRIGPLDKTVKKQITSALKQNDTYKAQAILLKELDRRYGGSFLAGGQTTAGKVAKFGDAIEDLQKSLATALLPTVSNLADALSELFRDPATIKATEEIGRSIGEMFSKDNIKKGIDALKEGFGVLKSIVGPIADVIKTAVNAFTSLPPEIQKLAVGAFAVNKLTGGLVTNLAGGLISAVISSFKGMMNVNAGVVHVNGPVVGGGPSLPGGGPGSMIGDFRAALAAGGLGLAAGLTIAAIAPAALYALTLAIIGGTEKAQENDRRGRQATAERRGIPGNVPTGIATSRGGGRPINPRRDNANGSLDRPSTVGPAVAAAVEKARLIGEKQVTTLETLKGNMAADLADQTHAISIAGMDGVAASKEAGQLAATGSLQGASNVKASVDNLHVGILGGLAAVVGAIGNIVISPTTISHTSTTINRYGPDGASRNSNGGNWGDPDRPR